MLFVQSEKLLNFSISIPSGISTLDKLDKLFVIRYQNILNSFFLLCYEKMFWYNIIDF